MNNEKKLYETPEVTKVEFDGEKITAETMAETIMMGC